MIGRWMSIWPMPAGFNNLHCTHSLWLAANFEQLVIGQITDNSLSIEQTTMEKKQQPARRTESEWKINKQIIIRTKLCTRATIN